MSVDELTETLLRPKFRRWATENDCVVFVQSLRLTATWSADPPTIPPVVRDPNDDYLVALARHADAHVLVSGDKDLTSMPTNDPPILTPSRFLATIDPAER